MRPAPLLLFCSLAALTACTDDPALSLGSQCEVNSDCEAPLVCRLERCRNECNVSRDCPLGARCVVNNDGLGSCTLEQEDSCTGAEDCPDTLRCVVGSCRNACEDDTDCASDATCQPVEERRACFGADELPERDGGLDAGPADAAVPEGGPPDGATRDAGAPAGVIPCDVDPGLPPCAGCTVVDVSAGGEHTCAVRSDGRVFCWGSNAYGQLATLDDTDAPMAVPDISTAVQVSAGLEHTCARLEAGGLRCWGNDAAGQLGDGPADSTGTGVVTVSGIGNAVDVSAGSQHTCAALEDGTARCWGSDIALALGNGAGGDSPVPVNVQGLAGAASDVSAGDTHSCAATEEGVVYCWGANQRGQLGDGTTDSSPVAVRTMVVTGAERITVGSSGIQGHSCARSGGSVLCWGNNGFGELGDGTGAHSPTAVEVSGLPATAVQVAAGPTNSCAALDSGEIWCWGDNFSSVLGRDGGSTDSPVRVSDIVDATRVTLGGAGALRHACVIVAGTVACWGSNSSGQLGASLSGTVFPEPHSVCGLD